MSTRGFLGMFSKAAPAADVTKLKPGIALPHVTLPTTEVVAGSRGGCWGSLKTHDGSPRLTKHEDGLGWARGPRGSSRDADCPCSLSKSEPWTTPSAPTRLDFLLCLQGGRVEVGAPTGRWQLVVVYRGKHDPLCVTYLAALQVGGRGLSQGGPAGQSVFLQQSIKQGFMYVVPACQAQSMMRTRGHGVGQEGPPGAGCPPDSPTIPCLPPGLCSALSP